jgi:thiol-disulfide isomerase/thioredoxin
VVTGAAWIAFSCSPAGNRAARDSEAPAATGAGNGPDTSVSPARLAHAGPLINTDVNGVVAAARAPGATVTLVNVWASWCAPCRQEFPDLVRLARDYRAKGVRVVFVSVDFESDRAAVESFLAEHGVADTSYLKSGDDTMFINLLNPKWTGALPATLLYNSRGELKDFWEGMSTYASMEQHVLALMKAAPPPPAKEPS